MSKHRGSRSSRRRSPPVTREDHPRHERRAQRRSAGRRLALIGPDVGRSTEPARAEPASLLKEQRNADASRRAEFASSSTRARGTRPGTSPAWSAPLEIPTRFPLRSRGLTLVSRCRIPLWSDPSHCVRRPSIAFAATVRRAAHPQGTRGRAPEWRLDATATRAREPLKVDGRSTSPTGTGSGDCRPSTSATGIEGSPATERTECACCSTTSRCTSGFAVSIASPAR